MDSAASSASDATLVDRLRASHDAAAIAEIVRRYAPMVYGACLRRGPAEAAARTCLGIFRALVAEPGAARGSLPVWLHERVLTQTPGADVAPPGATGDWAALAPGFDVAVQTLGESERTYLLSRLCALPPREGGPATTAWQKADAEAREVTITAAIAALVTACASQGLAATPTRDLIAENAREMVPPALASDLGRLALANLPGTAAGDDLPPSLSRARLYLKVSIGLLVLVVILAVVVWILRDRTAERGAAKPGGTPSFQGS